MYSKSRPKAFTGLILMLLTVLFVTGSLSAEVYYLRAEQFDQLMPDDVNIPMWGFALDSSLAFIGLDEPNAPGPILTVQDDADSLTIYVKNNLAVPISLVIPGLPATMVPVFFTPDDGTGRQRVMSFTHEIAPGGIDMYEWTDLHAGNFIYHSGTHPQVQVQMGLFGGLKVYAGDPSTPYADYSVDGEVDLYFSEIDPNLHTAVATGNYGPGLAVTSTMNYDPKYFLINGRPYDVNSLPIDAGAPDDITLLRFYNAGLESHVAMVQDLDMTILSEEGFLYPFERIQNTALLAAGQTRDALVTLPSTDGFLAVYDRALHLTNNMNPSGGMMAKLQVGTPAPNIAPVITLVTATPDVIFGTGECQAQLAVTANDPDGPDNALTYSWSAQNCMGTIIDPNTANPTFITPELSVGQVITITVYVTDDASTTMGTVDVTIQTAVAPISDLIIDNGDAGTTSTGTWIVSGGANPWGADSLYNKTAGDTYTFQGARSGENNVYMRWTAWPSRPASVQVQVFDGATPFAPVTVNQQINANTWFLLGTHTFTGTASVVITAAGANTSTNADAVMFESTVVGTGPYVDHIVIIGPSQVLKNASQNYDAMAVLDDGTTPMIEPVWSVSDPNQSIDEFGVLTTSDVTADTPIVITAEYTSMGCTHTDTLDVMVLNQDAPPAIEVIIDNLDAGASSTGAWLVSGGLDPWSTDSVYSRNADDTFTFTAQLAGTEYNLYMWWTAWSSRETGIPVTISTGGSVVDVVPISQQLTPSQWVWIGNYTLGADTQITITSPGGGSTCADAVKFTPGPTPPLTIIVDNGDAGTTFTGSWAVSGGVSPYGANSLWSRGVGDTYIWTTPTTGTFDVYVWWTPFDSRHTSVPYTIYDGVAQLGPSVVVDQLNEIGGQWRLLRANVTFSTSAKVTVESTTADFSTCADAVRLVESP